MADDRKKQQMFDDQTSETPADMTTTEIDEVLGEKGGISEGDIDMDIDETEFDDDVDFIPDLASDTPEIENNVDETGNE
jgi:hypothetical protein